MISDGIPLIDHHCHGLVEADLSAEEFRALGTESEWPSPPGLDPLDSPFGLGIRSRCAPLLDLPPHTGIDDYVERRRELGVAEVTRRLMAATGTGRLLVDTGFLASPVSSPERMTAATGIPAHTIARLERIAESIAPETTAATFGADFRSALAAAAETAVGFKSIMAYRTGFTLPSRPYSEQEVRAAAGAWLRSCEASGVYRVDDPVLLAHLVWEAVPYRKPIQLHVGFGDTDVHLHRADPSLLSGFLSATRESGADFMLLHCYPFVREAGSLAHVFPHVYLDVGLVSHYTGPSAVATVRESLEIAPFHKVLYSSDAYGLAEHYLVSATSWRRAVGTIFDEWMRDDWLSAGEAESIVRRLAADNALRVYRLGQS
jgi:predicted TIM-barrel fold metal-dependent hydrolase